jgi:MoxR-like ATPase
LIVEGEPGIGKTTLWWEVVEQVRMRGARVLVARTSPVESVLAYTALADLCAGVDGELLDDLPETQRRRPFLARQAAGPKFRRWVAAWLRRRSHAASGALLSERYAARLAGQR